jgi:hypothetical protein
MPTVYSRDQRVPLLIAPSASRVAVLAVAEQAIWCLCGSRLPTRGCHARCSSQRARVRRAWRRLLLAKAAAQLRLASDCSGRSDSSMSAASERSNRCIKTAPLRRSRSLGCAPARRPTRQSALAEVERALSRVALLLARKSGRVFAPLELTVVGRPQRASGPGATRRSLARAKGGPRRLGSSHDRSAPRCIASPGRRSRAGPAPRAAVRSSA